MDSVTGKPVSIGKPEILEQILSEKTADQLRHLQEKPEELQDTEIAGLHPHLISYRGIDREKGMLLAVTLEKLCVQTAAEVVQIESPVFAFPFEPSAFGKEYEVLLNSIINKENNNMNKIIKSGEVMKLKDLISYEDGSITNIDVVSNDTMKFVLMAFDEGTGLTPHRAPGNAIIFALEGKAVIDYEGKDYTISAGENFRFDKNGLHSVTADERFKMGLLLVLE